MLAVTPIPLPFVYVVLLKALGEFEIFKGINHTYPCMVLQYKPLNFKIRSFHVTWLEYLGYMGIR